MLHCFKCSALHVALHPMCLQRPCHLSAAVSRDTQPGLTCHHLLGCRCDAVFMSLHKFNTSCEALQHGPVCGDQAHACAGAGINDCEKKGSPCGPTHGQLQDGQSYLCVSFDASNLEKVADVLRGDELTIYASNIDGLADQYPNIQELIKANRRGD